MNDYIAWIAVSPNSGWADDYLPPPLIVRAWNAPEARTRVSRMLADGLHVEEVELRCVCQK